MGKVNWDKKVDAVKKAKDKVVDSMSNDCKTEIENGFDFKIGKDVYHFSYEQENQINFQNVDRLFEDGVITEVNWNAYLDGDKIRILLDKNTYNKLFLAGIVHKQSVLNKYNDVIIPSIDSITNIEDLKSLKWEDFK